MYGEELLSIARKGVMDALKNRYDPPSIVEKYKEKRGVFVTILKNNELRGCIGTIWPIKELGISVYENAIHAAIHDPRFPPVEEKEVRNNEIEIEISILTLPKKISFNTTQELFRKIKGKGVILRKNGNLATFLPQVWKELSDPEEFLHYLSLKAGINDWRGAEIEVYENEEVIKGKL